jgi:hypothetical protein
MYAGRWRLHATWSRDTVTGKGPRTCCTAVCCWCCMRCVTFHSLLNNNCVHRWLWLHCVCGHVRSGRWRLHATCSRATATGGCKIFSVAFCKCCSFLHIVQRLSFCNCIAYV